MWRTMIPSLALATAAMATFAWRATAAEYFVDGGAAQASDENAGTRDAPFKTISRGVKKLKPGDSVTIKAGMYREAVTVNTSGTADQPIVIQAAEGDAGKVVISGADPIREWKHEANVVWSTPWQVQFDPNYPANWEDYRGWN